VFERFTDRARRVVVLAQSEARMLNQDYIGTEHLLLGLIQEGEGVAARALEQLDISLVAVQQRVEQLIGRGTQSPTGHIPFTPRAKKVLELSLRESLNIGHNYIGTEHILLGLIREGEGVAAQVLRQLGADLERVRLEVLRLLAALPGAVAMDILSEAATGSEGRAGRRTRPGPAWRVERVGPDARFRRAGDEAERQPQCPRCGSDLTQSARYRIQHVLGGSDPEPEASEREPQSALERRPAAFLYCAECGWVLATSLPEP
jgi:ATP-dependent Clp protease ATP-binding subunit ClpC